MKIPIKFFLKWNACSDKLIKLVGDNIGKILVGVGISIAGIGVKTIPKEIEKKKTKYEYKGWIIYKRGNYVYAVSNHDKLKVKDGDFRDIERMIDAVKKK